MRRDCRTLWKDCRYARKVERWKYTGNWFRSRRQENWKERGVDGEEEQEAKLTIKEAEDTGKTKKDTGRRQGGRSKGEEKGAADMGNCAWMGRAGGNA